ncbi:hypothetical protein A3F07_02870 [candidate division WWE3 bacterium RIFCSPHIGHO2_12_FULL_38_15]|uniref:LytR/CpsA/Psr regulator C-terminal domain-containing protein n=1 Tax=candidate division WWE3 bacterium RIFCSPHIGHO2_02_FULL_38_14 TaxID=1802620 RepID=A0A1F4V9Z4_UNCKA|nr:MAG: hypothetical protein A2793_04495 [candidate division WWE3 bacterium RIFCSPHIGHO2_01_FULL_38_45]OGC49353.1 MAG: hypothetical protein A3F07_02870 [candidate division WWE3 bacterium RIFCSPHIGHO2_12_FULL_38_15]OGC53956.1 MAG: hypothetical protein A3B64_02975 [candidate division WWE3 bacterium RIFCSPLOWO2_01_FULL_37_24]OGC54032.1 MAG: hypothetical protein A3D91_04710 [candidate division WWE3 bacterium RIFCSPHIGHO2_02_FULL_38_14]HLB51455.1 LytR C-terminal domain-containing protein [Patescibac
MNDLLISINNNILKATLNSKVGFMGSTLELGKEECDDSLIVNPESISKRIEEILFQSFNHKKPDVSVSFLVEPKNLILKFVTVSKKSNDIEEQIISEAVSKLKDVSIEDLYFSYQKIAPFVYQFIGIKKDILEKYLEVCNLLKQPLKSVVPWVLLLPKFTNKNEPCIFVVKNVYDQMIALSEMNGVYFSAVYEDDISPEKLQKLVSELSVYKRANPITKIYTLNTQFFSLDPDCQVYPLEIDTKSSTELDDYKLHLLFEYVMENNPDLYSRQLNIVNMLQVPAMSKKNLSLVPAGLALILVAFLAVGLFVFKNRTTENTGEVAGTEKVQPTSDALNDQVMESSPSIVEKPELKKDDLKIKVENGAGIPGIAAKTRDFLNNLGYNVAEIGNADEIGRQDTLLKFKQTKATYKELLSKDLEGSYTVVTEETLPESENFDVLIIVGTH